MNDVVGRNDALGIAGRRQVHQQERLSIFHKVKEGEFDPRILEMEACNDLLVGFLEAAEYSCSLDARS